MARPDMLFDFRKRRFTPLLVITHAKAGSTWLDGILRSLFGKKVRPRSYAAQTPLGPGEVDVSFLNRAQFLDHAELAGTQRLIVIRDLRDTLISRYFSLMGTHENDPGGRVAAERGELQGMSKEDGLCTMLGQRGMTVTAEIQRSWVGAGEEIHRYDDLITDDLAQFRRIFLEKLELPLTAPEVEKAVLANRFESVYGRKLGEEDASSHGRKGTPGDWRNHFTPALAAAFQQTYGDLLLATGCERDPDWWKPPIA